MKIDSELLPVLFVALLTWGGVFAYLLRLEGLTRVLEKQVRDVELAASTREGEDAS
jgi:hypothetical protein